MIRLDRHPDPRFAPVAEIVLDRPRKRNALTPEMLRALDHHARALADDPACRAILIRGEGPAFCAGFDLTLCREDPGALADMLRALSTATRTLRRALKPVVVAAHAAAIAGGCALLAAADLVIADQHATFGYPVVKLGISPAVNAYLLSLAVGPRAARERLLDPNLITAHDARRIGLVHRLVDLPEDTLPRAQLEAVKLAEKPPAAFAATKQWLNEIEAADRDDSYTPGLDASLSLLIPPPSSQSPTQPTPHPTTPAAQNHKTNQNPNSF